MFNKFVTMVSSEHEYFDHLYVRKNANTGDVLNLHQSKIPRDIKQQKYLSFLLNFTVKSEKKHSLGFPLNLVITVL
jgi:hypothetical protein